MNVVKNSAGKTVCRADGQMKIVEIKTKNVITTIRFFDDGTYKVVNRQV